MHVVDEHRIRQLAGQLAGAADEVHATAGRLRTAAAGLGWHSPAGDAFAIVLAGLLGRSDRLGDELAGTAAALTAHGNRAARHAAELAAATGGTVAGRAAERAAHELLGWG
ncbi:MAG TPA: hypothetical protein VMB79_16900 [Jatrophihabitans sp.]|nr:hypothetical protein [Jatrophihabitans sp.]